MILRRSVTSTPGIRRVRRGRGFAYIGVDGGAVTATVRAWRVQRRRPRGEVPIHGPGVDRDGA